MSYTKNFIHFTWATYDRIRFLNQDNRTLMAEHIRNYAKKKSICLLALNVQPDHVHSLISVLPEQCCATIMNLIKGESSFWANRNFKLRQNFAWQDDYFAISVSPGNLDLVLRYIDHQDEHHKKKSFQDEYNLFVSQYFSDLG